MRNNLLNIEDLPKNDHVYLEALRAARNAAKFPKSINAALADLEYIFLYRISSIQKEAENAKTDE